MTEGSLPSFSNNRQKIQVGRSQVKLQGEHLKRLPKNVGYVAVSTFSKPFQILVLKYFYLLFIVPPLQISLNKYLLNFMVEIVIVLVPEVPQQQQLKKTKKKHNLQRIYVDLVNYFLLFLLYCHSFRDTFIDPPRLIKLD